VRRAYACAESYTRTEVAPDAETAPLVQLENVRRNLARVLRAPPSEVACSFEKLSVSFLRGVCQDFANTGCPYSKSGILSLCELLVRCSVRILFVKAVLSIAKSFQKKALTLPGAPN
jgi:hypothetical protein